MLKNKRSQTLTFCLGILLVGLLVQLAGSLRGDRLIFPGVGQILAVFFRLLGEQNVLADFFRRVLYEGDTRKGYLCFRTNNTASLREHMLETYRLFLNRVEYLNIILECRITELFCTLVRLYTETDPSGAEGGEPAGMGKILHGQRLSLAGDRPEA